MRLGKKITRRILARLEEARRSATMENADFDSFNGTAKNLGLPVGVNSFTELVKRETRTYRQSWIIDPIDEVIAVLRAELNESGD